MKPELKRKSQIGVGFTILIFAVGLSYFSVETIDTQETPQYDIYLVIDVSGSMAGNEKLVFAKQAAMEFVDIFQSDQSLNHQIGLVTFSDYSNFLVSLEDEPEKMKESISKLYPEGGTAMGDGISLATQSLIEKTRDDTTKVIVLLSDGASNTGLHPLIAAGTANDHDITIFSVGYGYGADVQTLKAVSSVTGGEYYHAPTGKELADTFNEIADILISPVSHYSSRILILLAIPVLLFIPTIERGLTTMMERVQDKPVTRNVKKSTSKSDTIGKNICKKCNHVNRLSSKFCIKCGDTIGKNICKKCNHVNRPSSKFCIKCGDTIGGYGR